MIGANGKFQLHYSGLSLIAKCGEAFRRRYILGEQTPPSASAAIGSGVDRSVTYDLKSKMDTGALARESVVADVARDALVKEWEKGVVDDGDGLTRGEATDHAVRLAVLHHRFRADEYAPTHLQRQWVCEIQGTAIQLAGTIDVQEGLAAVWDTKTSAKSPNQDEAARSLQLTTYALAVLAHDGAIPETVGLTYLVRTKVPKLVKLESSRTAADFSHLLLRVSRAEQIMKSGQYMPASTDAWWCDARYCGFHATCPYVRRPVSVGYGNHDQCSPDLGSIISLERTSTDGRLGNH